MAKDDLRQEIRNDLYGKGTGVTETKGTADTCEYCGSTIEISPTVEHIPEHGGNEVHRVTWCNDSCKQAWMDESSETVEL